MRLVFAADKPSVNDAAYWYWHEGLSVIPCRGKVPNIPTWQEYTKRRPTRTELMRWIADGKFISIGVICGTVSSRLVVMDLDGLAAVSTFEMKFPELVDTYTVKSGSGKGAHLYFQTDRVPQTARVSLGTKYGFELRSNGCYVIAPPSLHPDSLLPYVPANEDLVMRLPDLEPVRDWVHGLIRHKYAQSGATPPKPLPALQPKRWTDRETFMREAYLRSAIHQQTARITSASAGTRNTALYLSAQCLGQLIGGGELERASIETMLMNAAITVGLPEVESQKTIASGINAGISKPRRVPPAPKKA